ncbi:hypothetical protein RR11_2351 [Ruegeria sp. R11]|nr:hypothetical protein RR11_2351 [Ruegeria sp. R11]
MTNTPLSGQCLKGFLWAGKEIPKISLICDHGFPACDHKFINRERI